ncbi:MAG: DUF6916 family protein [Pyrinomonadaceae bacterium]
MKFSRRHFIKLGGATAAGILGFGNFAFGQKKSFFADQLPDGVLADPLFGYTAEDFRKYLGTEFSLMTEGAAITAVLTAVRSSLAPGKKSARVKRAECYTLSFQLPSNAPQATYTVFHPRLGTFDLFLVPGKTDNAEFLLHAVINRI